MLDCCRIESFAGIYSKKLGKNTLQCKDFKLSLGYLCFWDKLEKANCFLEKAIQYKNEPYDKREVYSWFQYAVTDGGFWTNFKELVKKYGIVPAEIRNAALEGKDIEDIAKIKEQALERIFTFLCRCYGCPSDTFFYSFENGKQKKQYTPETFYNDMAGEFLDQFVNVISLPYEKLPFGEKCIEQLKEGIPVVCMADDDKMCREELQLWDDNSFDYLEVTGFDLEMNRKDYFQLKAGIASHSMLITGVHLGENGKSERWKIENSYATDGIHKGYFVCSDSWFEKYIISAVISKKYILDIDGSEQRNGNVLNIWDIM